MHVDLGEPSGLLLGADGFDTHFSEVSSNGSQVFYGPSKDGTERVAGSFLLVAVTVSHREGKHLAHATQHGRVESPASEVGHDNTRLEGPPSPVLTLTLTGPTLTSLSLSTSLRLDCAPGTLDHVRPVDRKVCRGDERALNMETWHTHRLFMEGIRGWHSHPLEFPLSPALMRVVSPGDP